VCPVTAIFAEEDTPDQWKDWIPLHYDYFKDAEATRAKLNEMKPA
jgi:hypothetical protein